MSRLKGNSESCEVVWMTRESRTLAFPGRLVRTGPDFPCTRASTCPTVLCPSAGGDSVSVCGEYQHRALTLMRGVALYFEDVWKYLLP